VAARDERRQSAGAHRPPRSPVHISLRDWGGVLRRTGVEFRNDNLADWAAALTYYAVLSIFPTLLVLVSLLGLAGQPTIQPLLDNLGRLAPGPAREILSSTLRTLGDGDVAGVTAIIGLVVALWSASGYVGAFMRASNAVYEVAEGRPVWKTVPVRVAVTVTVVILLAVSALIVVFTGTLASRAGELLGLGQAVVTAWGIAKWPVLVLIIALVFAILYWAAPNVRQPGFRWVTPGSVVAVLVWIAASAAFGFYVGHFGAYHQTYGALASVIVFLIWLWFSNIAVLLGLELNSEIERTRAIEAGHPPDEEPFLEPRDRRAFHDEGGSARRP
jgi:membrane protein